MKVITNNILLSLCGFLSECENFVFLDTSKPDKTNSSSLLFVDPVARIRFFQGQNLKDFLNVIEQYQKQGFFVAGWFAYEFGYLFEPKLQERLKRQEDSGALLAELGIFPQCRTFDHLTGTTNFPVYSDSYQRDDKYTIENLHVSQKEEEYINALQQILKYIEAGDTYQVNYTLKLLFDFSGSPEQFYRDLRRNQSVGYGAYIRFGKRRIMSFSPELFFRKDEQSVMVRPMKGTLRRGRTQAEDEINRRFLQTDVKNQSENVMIVDLLRNDLGRLMHHLHEGDVRVNSLFDVETYETLLQMTSTITATTQPDALKQVSMHEFFNAIFPCGSVTGAPKIRTMEIIDDLEKQRRGVYTGAIGYLSPLGHGVFNVPIRTVVLEGAKGEMGIGSGIVYDSNPRQEWQECLLKGKFLSAPQKRFQLLETLLYHPEHGIFLLQEHLQRLQCSADFFLFSCDIEDIAAYLTDLCTSFDERCQRIRLLLEKDGTFGVESSACEKPVYLHLPETIEEHRREPQVVEISKSLVDTASVWLYHKTTVRDLYRKEYNDAVRRGIYDKIFQNEKGCVTESCIANLMVYKNGEYFTPPLSDGLLGGVMRRHLLEKGAVPIVERSLTPYDIFEAEALFLCNSVRGVVRVEAVQG
ncbi:MAG: aminodeoxychorismate synthase component I [Desulfopila sp.]|jgi:para-aminobenzoate synthetase/4-amino-4-deoxychorismate lyase|nr:aminodeoxychorismate synthase component I [Desulfopila sp.]